MSSFIEAESGLSPRAAVPDEDVPDRRFKTEREVHPPELRVRPIMEFPTARCPSDGLISKKRKASEGSAMWIVELALRRPYTVAVMSLLILVMAALSVTRMVVDIFPAINIPVVAVVWNYPGMSSLDMERRVVRISEGAYSTTVNGIDRIESQSIPGVGMLKIYFHPGTDIASAIAQISAVSGTVLRFTPPGLQPPAIIQFDASNVPVAQLTISSATLPEQQLFDYGLQFIRLRLFTIPGLSAPPPFGGKSRQINIDVDPSALAGKGISPSDVVAALQNSNIIVPAGSARIGDREYSVQLNSSPEAVDQFSAIPIRVVGNTLVRLGDVARASDSFADQTNIVHVDGNRAAYLAILKHADASTLAVVEAARGALPAIRAVAPQGMDLKIDFDQSVFVRAAIQGVLSEALISSVLVSILIGLFLRSWRSMIIVCTSIPLAICSAVVGLALTGNSLNIMTLGGLALAVGMLVDDATVEVENIHRNHASGKPITVAILDGAKQIAVPAIVSTLAICIVFFPVVLLYGPARYLFQPLAAAVVFAMLASYLLSRTLVPALAHLLMRHEDPREMAASCSEGADLAIMDSGRAGGLLTGYVRLLQLLLRYRAFVLCVALVVLFASVPLVFLVGRDFFPKVDAGLMKLHVRAPIGTRIEVTERLVRQVEGAIRSIVRAEELETVNDMIGVPVFQNLAFVQTDNIGSMDAEILIALKSHHRPIAGYMRELRAQLAEQFPGAAFYFQPADIVDQILNFGSSAPIEVQVEHRDLDAAFEVANKLRNLVSSIPGTVDVHIPQVLSYPTIRVDVDQSRAAQIGLTQREVSNNLLTSLSSSGVISPSYYVNPTNNVSYLVAVKTPLQRVDSMAGILSTPITPPTASNLVQADAQPGLSTLPSAPTETLGNIAGISTQGTPGEVTHHTVQRVVSVSLDVDGRDLGAVASDIEGKIRSLGKLPVGMKISVRGQAEVMNQSFRNLALGLLVAILLVYCLMVVLFQSWLDPFIIMMAVPGALVGILWMLGLTHTTINVESLMGSIMSVGIAVSNSILIVTFANDLRVEKGLSALEAALVAGRTRLRPVLMTACAMIAGMLPAALSFGEAGEQNAPLGRAVIGGLLMATVVTLFVIPIVYSLLRSALPTKHVLEARFQREKQGMGPKGASS